MDVKMIPRPVRSMLKTLAREAALHDPAKYFRLPLFRKMRPLKLNIGCGKVKYPGWVNIDMEPGADLVIDIRKGLPFDDGSVDLIYCEHVIEHFTYEDGEKVLKEFKRCLNEKGVVRIAVPDLDYVIAKYNGDWKNQDWLSWPEYAFIKSKGRMINVGFRWWGHQYLYNEEDLEGQLRKAGFAAVSRREWCVSPREGLSGLETRKDSTLIMEAEK